MSVGFDTTTNTVRGEVTARVSIGWGRSMKRTNGVSVSRLRKLPSESE